MTLREIVAVNVRNIRIDRKLTQELLAELADIHTTYVSEIERAEANATLDVVERIAGALDVSVSELVTFRGELEGIKKVLFEQAVSRMYFMSVGDLERVTKLFDIVFE